MWSNHFKRLRKKRAPKTSVPKPEARILEELTASSQSAYHSTISNSYPDYTSYPSYIATSSTSPPISIAMSSSTASPAYSASMQQASPYYSASFYVPSPVGSELAHTPSPPPQQLSYAHSSAQRRPPPSSSTMPLHQELGIAQSRADYIFIIRQYEATERRIARAVPDGLARVGQRRHTQEEDSGATVYTVAKEHLINMRQALSCVSRPITFVTAVPEASAGIATADGILTATSHPNLDPTQAPKDIIPILVKIEEAERESEAESDTLTTDEHEQDMSTPDRDTTPELSSGSGSPASQDTFPSAVLDNGLDNKGWSLPLAKLDNGKFEPDWKINIPLETLDRVDELKGWEKETVDLLIRIGSDQENAL